MPYDRTTGVFGPQGSGKTLDLLTPALLAAPGAALVTLTKSKDLTLSYGPRSDDGRPAVVLDPFGLVPGLPELVWDPIAGCGQPLLAERRAKAFTAGTVKGAVAGGTNDDAARFYAEEAAKVLKGYFHAAALAGADLEVVMEWIADPRSATAPEEILRTHPGAAPMWDGLLRGAIRGDERTAGNTITTVQQAVALYFQPEICARCVPAPGRPATDLAEVIARRGTIYLLGRDDPYASASPLMTAVAEDVLDTALALAETNPWTRMLPAFLSVLDELPSTTPLPTLATRMANDRDLGLSFIFATQTFRQLVMVYGREMAESLFGLANNLVIFGGSKDVDFNRDISDLLGPQRILRRTRTTGGQASSTSYTGEDVPVMRPHEVRRISPRHALVIPEYAAPIMARLYRCVDGPAGTALLARQAQTRALIEARRSPSSARGGGSDPGPVGGAATAPPHVGAPAAHGPLRPGPARTGRDPTIAPAAAFPDRVPRTWRRR